ncbi:MAG TPA: hypothetical protein VD862_02865 [Candidatus Paceibacterota bacterium]|nr:hypothetical protein [Candidatus Paceibacterota bacterium]
MLSAEIKELLRTVSAAVIVEDGRPSYIVTAYETWRQMAQGSDIRVNNGRPGHLAGPSPAYARQDQETAVLERLNKEILSLRQQIQMQEDSVGDDDGGQGEEALT